MTTGPSLRFPSWLLSICALLAILALAPARTWAQLPDAADSYTTLLTPNVNHGSAATLFAVYSNQSLVVGKPIIIDNTYIRFDLSALPAGLTAANISKATLKLFVSSLTTHGLTDGTINVYLVTSSWNENNTGVVGKNFVPGITYGTAPSLGAAPIGSGVPVAGVVADDYLLVDVTPALQAWLSGSPNYGLALVGTPPPAVSGTVPPTNFEIQFESKESATGQDPDALDVDPGDVEGRGGRC